MHFRRSDRRALLFLFTVILAFWGGVLMERRLSRPSGDGVMLDEVAMDSLSASTLPLSSAMNASSSLQAFEPETFPFDPNSADSATLHRLGLSDWQIRNIYKYRAHGGRYHRPEDFKRLYGMTPELYERLAPAIRIDKRFRYYDEADFAADNARRAHYDSLRVQSAAVDAARRDSLTHRYPRQDKFTELVQLDLNTVDSTTLKKVPGIASVRARQILRYRDRLGGYSSVDQLSEINDMPLEIQAWFFVGSGVYRKLNLNTATIGEMARHPYIGNARARAIDNYRRIQGRIQSLDDFRLLPAFSDADIRRIQPYVEW